MENESKQWRFKARKDLISKSDISIRGMLNKLWGFIDATDPRPTIHLSHGDPSAYPSFRTTPIAEDAIIDAVRSAKFNGYAPTNGVLPARRAIAEYLSSNLPYNLSPDDVNLTSGCLQAIEVIISVLSQPGTNILFPRPGFPAYEASAAFSHLEFRHFDLLPERGWEIDLDAVESLADDNTAAIVVNNPGNPCGYVYTYQHLQKIAETARRLGIMVIADEVYESIVFGTNPFVPMGTFGSIVPVITLGAISKKWMVPGWRLGWLVITDPNGVLKETKIVESIHGCLNINTDPATFIQAAIPKIIENTKEDFFKNIIDILRQASSICYEGLKGIDCLTCPHKPEGSMFVMVKLNLSLLEDISDDIDFCCKLIQEENVVILPGITVGLKNWLRITFAIEPSSLEDSLVRFFLSSEILKKGRREEEMENGLHQWRFKARKDLTSDSDITVRGMLNKLHGTIDANDPRPTAYLGHGDPSAFPCFRTTPVTEDAIVGAVRSAKFNGYAPTVGVLPARQAIAEYLSSNLPYKLSPDDVNLTIGCAQAIEVILSVLSQPDANVLLPRPGFPLYEARSAFSHLEFRHFDLLPERGWEVDLDAVEALADDNTAAMVIINPGNPCGNVYSYQHLQKIAETARRLGIMVIADEVYERIVFGTNPFVPMGTFGSIAPVITLGSISKRWVVPGWRLGWLVITDPNGILKETKIVDSIHGCLNISSDPATFVQGAIPKIIEDTKEDFFKNVIEILRQAADICYEKLKDIDCLTCPQKPEGSMFAMVKLNLSFLDDISDDMDFCYKLVKEEKVVILPGISVGMKNWLRVTFAVEPSSLDDALGRVENERSSKLECRRPRSVSNFCWFEIEWRMSFAFFYNHSMISNPDLVLYACVSKGTTVLAKVSSGNKELKTLALECLQKTPSLHANQFQITTASAM
ncbi:hypothetical protein NE237_024912 [Protea cynaroides]|uniref:Aminotransferase class I/classII large domain-containing protein n=1 Tax=Protea cynaroides TaxID=273540 RepID=A0A9Q0H0T7_9MAGN|nr:hypothetical protein NE237_024912 [Protea cynaroides]